MTISDLPLPSWVNKDDPLSVQNFKLKIASIYHNPKGSTKHMADDIGITQSGLCQYVITPANSIALETLLTRELFPREYFRPDMFVVNAAAKA